VLRQLLISLAAAAVGTGEEHVSVLVHLGRQPAPPVLLVEVPQEAEELPGAVPLLHALLVRSFFVDRGACGQIQMQSTSSETAAVDLLGCACT